MSIANSYGRLSTLKEIVNNLLMWCLEWLLCLLHLMLLDCLTKALIVSTKGLMNHHLTSLLIALSVLLLSIHQLSIVYLELLIFLQKISLKSRYIITRKGTRHGKQVKA